MTSRFKDKMMQGIYELGLTATYPIPLRFDAALGGSARVAWECGYLGLPVTRYDRDSMAYAAWCAGKKVKSIEEKNKK